MASKKSKNLNKKDISSVRKKLLIGGAVICLLLIGMFAAYFISANQWAKDFTEKASLLQQKAMNDDSYTVLSEMGVSVQDLTNPPINATADYGMKELDEYIVFFTVCDTKTRGTVINAAGATLEEAWEAAESKARKLIRTQRLQPIWVKADIVDTVQKIEGYDFEKITSVYQDYFFRKGISFDQDFETAFLESEVNGNKLLDYETHTLDINVINKYLTNFRRENIAEIPDEFFLFDCNGYFCDEDNTVYALYGYGNNDGLDYGRRILDEIDGDTALELVLTNAYWLTGEVKEDGAFHYGYYASSYSLLTWYNTLRHITGILPMMWGYEVTGDEAFVPKIKSTVDFLTEDSIVYLDENTAFVLDEKNEEIKLGGNGLAIIMLDQYMKLFETTEYIDLCKKLGNGILALMNQEEGTFYHVLYPDFSKKEEYRTVYYDGEATYALSILYGITGEQKWLTAAKSAADQFIRNDYTQYRDHWVSYAINEITKYAPEEKYFNFGLRNVQVNLDTIYKQDTSYHTYLELLMAAFNMYDRMVQRGITVEYAEKFDDLYFIETIFRRAEHMLNGYLYPEYAMYLKNPQKVVNTFCVRHHDYRARIDDVDHFVAAYYHFYENYDKLVQYRKELRRNEA